MKKFAPVALAAMVAVTGAVPTAHAALSERDAPVWRMTADVQVAGRGGDRGGRNDGGRSIGGRGRDAQRDVDNDVIWRLRGGRQRPFFLFRRDRGEDCFVRKVRARDASGNMVTKSVRMCE